MNNYVELWSWDSTPEEAAKFNRLLLLTPALRRFQCERCGGTGRQEAGKYDGRQMDAGECTLCGGEGLLGEIP